MPSLHSRSGPNRRSLVVALLRFLVGISLLLPAMEAIADPSTRKGSGDASKQSVRRNKDRQQVTPGYWYSPEIVTNRGAPLRSMPIKPVPVPPMFPAPEPYAPPGAVQPGGTYGDR